MGFGLLGRPIGLEVVRGLRDGGFCSTFAEQHQLCVLEKLRIPVVPEAVDS